MQNSVPNPKVVYATAKRRLLSMAYDSLLLGAVIFIAMAIFMPIAKSAGIESGHPVFSVYLFSIIFIFNAGFWTHGGQTLGMKTWKIKLIHEDGKVVNWGQALLRFLTALPSWLIIIIGSSSLMLEQPFSFPEVFAWINKIPGGVILAVGLLMLYIDQRPNNWRDRFSHTRVIYFAPSTDAS